MPTPPAYSPSWYTIGGTQPPPGIFGNFWTWAQVRVAIQVGGAGPNTFWGIGVHQQGYPQVISAGSAADSKGLLFRGIPIGIDAAFYTEAQPAPSTDLNWYFFWGNYYESPPGSGIFLQGIGASVDQNDIGGILDGATVVCQNLVFVTNSTARDPSGKGQFLATYPAGNPGPGSFVSVTSA